MIFQPELYIACNAPCRHGEKYRQHIYIHQDQQERDDSDSASEEDERVRLYTLLEQGIKIYIPKRCLCCVCRATVIGIRECH